VVPPAVVEELQAPGAPDAVKAWIAAHPSWLEVRNPESSGACLTLGRGEREAICLASELSAWCLIDDRKARREAERMGVRVTWGQFGVGRSCRLAAPGMMKMELGFGSLWLEAGVGSEADDQLEPRARVSVWPGRPNVPGIVAPEPWGARGAECLLAYVWGGGPLRASDTCGDLAYFPRFFERPPAFFPENRSDNISLRFAGMIGSRDTSRHVPQNRQSPVLQWLDQRVCPRRRGLSRQRQGQATHPRRPRPQGPPGRDPTQTPAVPWQGPRRHRRGRRPRHPRRLYLG